MAATKKLLGIAKRKGFREGVMGSSRAWMALWAGLSFAGWVRKKSKQPQVVERFTLQPGQTVVVTDLGISLREEKQLQKQEQSQ